MTRSIIVITFLLCACNYNSNHPKTGEGYPLPGELKYAIGDCLSFKESDSTYGCAVVCDFLKDEGGIWYGVFYSGYESAETPTMQSIKEGKVMGRKVESGIDVKGYERYLDGDFIIDSIFTAPGYFTLIGNLKLNSDIHLGSNGAVTSMPDITRSFRRGKEFRMKPPDHYKDYLKKLNDFHPEEYFAMKEFAR